MMNDERNGNKVVQTGLRSMASDEGNQELNKLREEIAKGDADYQSGRTFEYTTPNEMILEIINGH